MIMYILCIIHNIVYHTSSDKVTPKSHKLTNPFRRHFIFCLAEGFRVFRSPTDILCFSYL